MIRLICNCSQKLATFRDRAVVVGISFLLTLIATHIRAEKARGTLPFAVPDAGGEAGSVYQLTNVRGSPFAGHYDWYAFYYHDNDNTIQDYYAPGHGNKLVLRRMDTAGSLDGPGRSPSSVVYFALDLDTGTLAPVTQRGFNNDAYVKDQWLYVAERDTVSQHYYKLVRCDILHGNWKQEIGVYPELANSAKQIGGNLVVSDDQHYLIWTEDSRNNHYEVLWDELINIHGLCPERFCARKGQALIWVANLLHGGDRVVDFERTRWSQVTHYYFEGCSYYTPLTSDPFKGVGL
jgi:hypothetical protein